MVKAIPMKEAVRRATPTEPGPTMLSCCMEFFQWILPVTMRTATWTRRKQHRQCTRLMFDWWHKSPKIYNQIWYR